MIFTFTKVNGYRQRNIRWSIFTWNWDNPELANRVMDEEGRIPVRTFSNAHSVELIVNGESQGGQDLYQEDHS